MVVGIMVRADFRVTSRVVLLQERLFIAAVVGAIFAPVANVYGAA